MSKQTPPSMMPEWIFRVFLLSFGALLVAIGWEAQSHGYLWAQTFSERYGRPVVSPTLAWILLGGLLILTGLVSVEVVLQAHEQKVHAT
jgi:hypothetical protein